MSWKTIAIVNVVISAFVIGSIFGYVGFGEGNTASYWRGYNEGMDKGMYVTCEIIRECRDSLSEGKIDPFLELHVHHLRTNTVTIALCTLLDTEK